MTIFYVLAAVIIVGLTTLIWRRLQGSENWDRDASFFVDLLAMSATALIVGILAFNQLQAAPGEETSLAQRPVITETAAPTDEATSEPVETPDSADEEESVADDEEASPTPRSTATSRATRTPRATPEATEAAEPSPEAEATETAEPTATEVASPTAEPTEPPSSGTQSYTVKAGDRLGSIATAYGVTVAAIAAANPGIDVDNLQVGQVLVIPTAQNPAGTPVPASGSSSGSSPSPRTYTVQSGDYLNTIAARFGVTTAAIVAANPGLDSDNLQVGQVLIIP